VAPKQRVIAPQPLWRGAVFLIAPSFGEWRLTQLREAAELRLVVARQRVVEPLQLLQRKAAVGEGFRIVGVTSSGSKRSSPSGRTTAGSRCGYARRRCFFLKRRRLFTECERWCSLHCRSRAEALRPRPGMKLLFTTGYTRNYIVHDCRLYKPDPRRRWHFTPIPVGECARRPISLAGSRSVASSLAARGMDERESKLN
jgi:hypothetical protein